MRVMQDVVDLVGRFETAEAELAAGASQRHFCGLYRRSTLAVRDELAKGGFADADWVARLTVAFARLYLEALDDWTLGREVALPWQLALEAPAELSPLVHQLIGLNAHLNFDLPRALLAVDGVEEFGNDPLLERRQDDFQHIDAVMLRRLPEEYRRLRGGTGPVGPELLTWALYPLNLMASRRWLVAARRSVWNNALHLSAAGGAGEAELARAVADLEVLCAAKVAEIRGPGQVVLRLAVAGFGVTLPSRARPGAGPQLVGSPGASAP